MIHNLCFVNCGGYAVQSFCDIQIPWPSVLLWPEYRVVAPSRNVWQPAVYIAILYVPARKKRPRRHTFYTHYFCNKLFSKGYSQVELLEVEYVKKEILFSFEPSYLTLQSVLSTNQFKLIKGIAIEGSVSGVSSSAFLSRHGLAQSSALQALKVLLNKELQYEELHPDGSKIKVYDPFFSRWLEMR